MCDIWKRRGVCESSSSIVVITETMSFSNQLSREMALDQYSDQNVDANYVMSPSAAGRSQPPTWLNTAISRNQYRDNSNFLNLQTTPNSAESTQPSSNQWLSRAEMMHRNDEVAIPVSNDAIMAAVSPESADLNEARTEEVQRGEWQNAKWKGELLAHPLYEQLLAAHVACLRIATPVDQLPRINAQLTQSQQVVAKYSGLGNGGAVEDKELDQFMVIIITHIYFCLLPIIFLFRFILFRFFFE